MWGLQPEGSKSEGWGHGGSTAVSSWAPTAFLLILLACGTAAAATQYSSSWGCCFSKEQREQAMPAAWATWALGLPRISLRVCCDQGASVTFGPTCLVLMADSAGPVGDWALAQRHHGQDMDFPRTAARPCPWCCWGGSWGCCGATDDETHGLAPGFWFTRAGSGHPLYGLSRLHWL